jgi:hypothetical protein
MSDDEYRQAANIEAADEVEAHKRTAATANEEAGDELEDDVEAHMRNTSPEDHRRAARPI